MPVLVRVSRTVDLLDFLSRSIVGRLQMNQRGAATKLSLLASAMLVGAAVLVIAGTSPLEAQQRGKTQTPAVNPAQPAAKEVPKEAAKPALIYSPWTKICSETGAYGAKPAERKRVCLTAKEVRLESGLRAAGVALIEPDKEARKLRVSLPLGMQFPAGTRSFLAS